MLVFKFRLPLNKSSCIYVRIIEYGLIFIKTFSDFLSDILEKVRCYSAGCGGQVIVEDHCEFEESTYKESQEYSGEDFDIID